MTRDELDSLIETKCEDVASISYKDEKYEFLENFYSKNSFSKATDFLDVDIINFLQCVYLIRTKVQDVSECLKIKEFMGLFLSFDVSSFKHFANVSEYFYMKRKLDYVIKYLQEKNYKKSQKLLKKIALENDKEREVLERLREVYFTTCDADMVIYFDMLRENYNLTIELMNLLYSYKVAMKVKDDMSFMDLAIIKYYGCGNNYLEKAIKAAVKMSDVNNLLKEISDYISDVDIKEEKLKKENSRMIRNIKVAKDKLDEALSSDLEITDSKEIVRDIKDEEICYGMLSLIYEHNQKFYLALEHEYNTIVLKKKYDYDDLLRKYEIMYDAEALNKISKNSLEDVETMINYFLGIGVDRNLILKVLKNSNLQSILRVKKLLDRSILNYEVIRDNISIFYTDSFLFELVSNNIKLLDSYGISLSLFSDDSELFLDQRLGDNIGILNDYKFLDNLKDASDFSFLSLENLDVKIDKLLELGYEKMLLEDLGLLNYDNYGRLEVLKAIGMLPLEKQQVVRALRGRFFVRSEEIDDFIPSIVSYKEKIDLEDSQEKLSDYIGSLRTYNFNGVLISSVKVSRLLQGGSSLYEALFSNTNLSEDEYNLVITELKAKKMVKREK